MAKGLLDIPAELQTAVMWWILRPSEVAKLCLVLQQLHNIAMPLLYRSIYLNVDHWKTKQLDLIQARGHPGHRHIRSLDIDSDELKTEAIALKVAKDALHILPRDCLKSFRYGSRVAHNTIPSRGSKLQLPILTSTDVLLRLV